MEKQEVLKISKSDFRSCYHFRKKQSFFQFVRNFLEDLGFEKFQVANYGCLYSEEIGDYIGDKEEDIDNYHQLDNYGNEIYSFDIIPLSDRMVMIIHYKEDKQQEIVSILEKYVDWGQD